MLHVVMREHALTVPSLDLHMQVDFVELEKVALSSPDPIEDLPSGSAELYEIILGSYIR